MNGTVAVGDIVTVTNQLHRKAAWLVTSVKDTHPTCMEAVPNTSTWKVSGKTYTNNPAVDGTQVPGEVSSGPGWVRLKPGAGWAATPLIWTQDYRVKCGAGEVNTGGLEWATTWVGESGNNKANVGPVLRVDPGRPSISVSPTDATVANDVRLTIRHPEGLPGMPVVLTTNGKTLPGCTNLALNGDREVTCTWVPTRAGTYPLKAVIGSSDPVTVNGQVQVTNAGTGSLDTGSLGGFGS